MNPPIRSADDAEALWQGVIDGTVDWVASDHACCMEEHKGDQLWPALPGFGGTALLIRSSSAKACTGEAFPRNASPS